MFVKVGDMVRTLGAFGAVILLAALSWVSAADRIAANSAQIGATYFGGEADADAAFGLLRNHDSKDAVAKARRAVRTASVDPSTTSALGSALLADNQPNAAYAAFAVAGELGWRDVPTQLYWLTQAEMAGDIKVVVQRLDALLRLDIQDDTVINSLHVLGQTQTGRVALATLLAGNPPWEHRFLIETGALQGVDLETRIAAISLAASHDVSMDCEAVGIATSQLVRNHQIMPAKKLWRQACDRAGSAFLSDGDFELHVDPASRNPFTWHLRPQGDLDVDVKAAPLPLRGQALRIESAKTARTIAANQLVALPPGTYQLSWTSALDDGDLDRSVRILVECQGKRSLVANSAIKIRGGNRSVTTFSIPAKNCPLQIIAIQKAASGLGQTRTGWIDDIRIQPAKPARTARAAELKINALSKAGDLSAYGSSVQR